MITGRRIAGSLIAAAALSLTLLPAAAAEPKAEPGKELGTRVIESRGVRTVARTHDHGLERGTGLSLVCKLSGKPHGKAPALSANDLERLIKLSEAKPPRGQVSSCKIISGSTGTRIVRPRGDGAPPALNEFPR